jgi:hypothetical protein
MRASVFLGHLVLVLLLGLGLHTRVAAQAYVPDVSRANLLDSSRCYAVLALINENGGGSEELKAVQHAFELRAKSLLAESGQSESLADIAAPRRAQALRNQTLPGWMRQASLCWADVDPAYGRLRLDPDFVAAGNCWAVRTSVHDDSVALFFAEFDLLQEFRAAGVSDALAHGLLDVVQENVLLSVLGPQGPGMDARSNGCLAKVAGPLRRSAYAVTPPGVDASDWAAFRALPEAGRAAICSALSDADRDIGATPSYREVPIKIFAAAGIHYLSPISSDMGTRLDRMPEGRERAAAACTGWASAVEAN